MVKFLIVSKLESGRWNAITGDGRPLAAFGRSKPEALGKLIELIELRKEPMANSIDILTATPEKPAAKAKR